MATFPLSQSADWSALRRRVWELHLEGWDHNHIAAILGLTPGAVDQWVRRAQADEDRKLERIMEHLGVRSKQNIHIFRDAADDRTAEILMRKVAQNLNFYPAVLDGTSINSKIGVIMQLAKQYEFPEWSSRNYERFGWDSLADLMADLTWITGWPRGDKIKGFLLLYLDPEPLYSTAAPDLAMFLDVVETCTEEIQTEGIPFHIIVGPLDHSVEIFIRLLKVSDHLCTICEKTPLISLSVPAV